MQSMIQQLASDRADYDRVARKWTQAHAVGASHFLRRCSPAIRRRALYLMWVARQLEALHGLPADALLDPWVEFIVPLCVFVPDKTRQDKPDFLITAEAKAAAERATAEKEAAERAAGSYLVKPTIFLTSCADDCGGRAGSAPGAVAVPGRAPSRARPVPGRAVRLAVMPAAEALAGGGRGAPSPNLAARRSSNREIPAQDAGCLTTPQHTDTVVTTDNTIHSSTVHRGHMICQITVISQQTQFSDPPLT
jgi:hypothetical protein